ncbi:MAG: FimV/HubP family polar landmark protein [Moraxellaceae bacterium]|nr:FimV/HubP family polar landmark protein [Moraxellaceae bacterium]
MMVLRKLAVALLSVGVLLPGLGHALAVKDVQTKSALGEPFYAEVELSEIGDLNPDEIKVTLATQEDFERLGIDRVFFLNDLRFDVVLNSGNRSFVKITSSKPVREPYLDFVVRIAWPGNARLQNVTALLDPPLVADTTAPDVQPAVAGQQAATPAPVETVAQPVVQPVVATPLAPVAQESATPPKPVLPPKRPVAERPVRQPEPVTQSDGYRTRAGDTMSRVAEQLRPSDAVTAAQTMIAIQRANPHAFVNNNINLLKRDQVLQIPSESQIREVSTQEAVASIREQSQAWRASRPAAVDKPALEAQQVSAAPAPAPVKPPVAEPKPEMKLLAAQTGKPGTAAAGKDQSVVSPAEAKKLDENRVKAEAAKAEKDKLAAKVGTLDAQVKSHDQQIDVQNAKLAELQAKLKAQKEAADAAAAKQAPVAEAAPAAEVAAETPDGVKTESADVAPVVAATPLPAAEKPKAVTPPPAAPVEEESSLLLPLAGVAALLLGVAGFFGYRTVQRRKQEEEEALAELEAADAGDVGAEEPGIGFAFGASDNSIAGRLDGAQPALDDDFPGLDDVSPVARDRVLADPLEEVEQYLAYERYPQAAGFLAKAVAAAPERADLRMKLLEVYAHLDDHNGFAEQESWFENAGDLGALGRAEELKAGMSALPVAKSHGDLIDFESSKSAVAADDDLPSLEDLEMDFNATVSASSPSLQSIKDTDFDTSLDLSDDFSFDEPAAAAPATASAAPAAADSGLSLDEDLDFSFDATTEAKPSTDYSGFDLDEKAFADAPAAASDAGLDFSLDEEVAEPAAKGASFDLGEVDFSEFDSAPAQTAAAEIAVDDDLSFSLDDLEASVAEGDGLDGDFSLNETASATPSDFSFDDTLADAGTGDAAADFDATLQAKAHELAAVVPPVAAPAPAPAASSADLGMDDEFDFLADTDENATKLDLARAYIDMGDMEGARDILQEVLSEGNGNQKDEAKGLLAQVG